MVAPYALPILNVHLPAHGAESRPAGCALPGSDPPARSATTPPNSAGPATAGWNWSKSRWRTPEQRRPRP